MVTGKGQWGRFTNTAHIPKKAIVRLEPAEVTQASLSSVCTQGPGSPWRPEACCVWPRYWEDKISPQERASKPPAHRPSRACCFPFQPKCNEQLTDLSLELGIYYDLSSKAIICLNWICVPLRMNAEHSGNANQSVKFWGKYSLACCNVCGRGHAEVTFVCLTGWWTDWVKHNKA